MMVWEIFMVNEYYIIYRIELQEIDEINKHALIVLLVLTAHIPTIFLAHCWYIPPPNLSYCASRSKTCRTDSKCLQPLARCQVFFCAM